METYLLYVNGELKGSKDNTFFDSVNPATGEVIAKVAKAGYDDALEAIHAAREAFDQGPWTKMSGEERGKILKQITDKINEHQAKLVELEVADSGSTLRKAGEDIFLSAKSMNYYSKMAAVSLEENIEGLTREGVSKNILVREPIGVVSAIIPWNFPFKMFIWKIAPALAAGCTVVIKLSPETCLSVLYFARILNDTGLPKGVLNIITGDAEVGTEMVTNPLVDKIAFTGSTEVGKLIMKNASGTMKKVTLECGGKSANIVLDDADIDLAVDGAIYAGFYHQGQCCEGGTRLLVQSGIYDEFIGKLKEKTGRMKIGEPGDKNTKVGPVVSQRQFDTVMNYIKAGKDEGAEILTGGNRVGDKGYYIEPTIFVNVKNDMKIAQEEIFGPVVAVIKFDDDEEAIKIANDSIYGLGGAVWSSDDERAMKIAKRLKTGTVWINEYHLLSDRAPFGGYKQSGIGREFGSEGLKEYTEVKHIHLDQLKTRDKKPWFDTVVPK